MRKKRRKAMKIRKLESRIDEKEEISLTEIKELFEEDTNISNTKYYTGSLRSGQKLEFNGSIVVTGDVNGGSEIVATKNVVVVGDIRGIVHAGSNGNTKAYIYASSIEAPQIRLADQIKDDIILDGEKKFTRALLQDGKIVLD
jgi:septum site-determining protein MinC